MIDINMFKAVRNILHRHMYTYTIEYVPTCFLFFMYEWTVHDREMKKLKEGTVSASKHSDLFSLNANVV